MKKFQRHFSSGVMQPNPRTVLMDYHQRVNVTHWISPFCFYVRPVKIEREFKLLSDNLHEALDYETPLTRSLPVGGFVIAELPTLSEVWRAKIISVNEVTRSYDIHCIDTGKTLRDVLQEYVFMLPQRFIEIPPFAIKCRLPQIIATVDVPTLAGFAKSLWDNCDQLWCTFTSTDGDKTNCVLKCDNACMRTTLICNKLVDVVPEGVNLNIMIGQTILAKIEHFKDLSFFQVGISGSLNTFYCTYTHFNLLTDGMRDSRNFGYAFNGKSVPLRIDALSEENWLVVTPLVSLLNYESPIMPICNMVVCKRSLEVKLTHLASANVVYVTQIEHENHYKKLSKRMQAFYNSKYSLPYCQLVNTCAAKDDTNIWHRAEVMSSDKDLYTVRHIDSGERHVYHVDRLKSLASSFAEDPAIALRIYMLHESIVEESMVIDDLKKYLQMVVNLRIIEFYNGHWIGEIELGDTNVVQMLRNQNLVRPVDINCVKQQIANTASNCNDGVRIDAIVTHTISPNQFYVQRMMDIGNLRALERELDQSQCHPLEKFTVNTMCVAMFSSDMKWYRAKIIDNDPEVISVFFVDYGYTDYICDKTLLRELPNFCSDASPFSICCSLPVTPRAEHWSDHDTVGFESVVQQPSLRFSYIKQSQDLNYVELWVEDNNSVSEMLIQQNIAYKYIKMTKKCYITHVNSLSSFYVQEDDSTQMLDRLIQMLQSSVEESDVIEEPCEGLICLAQSSSDDLWYRARVLCSATMEVFYIDYGNTSTAIEIRSLQSCSVTDIEPLVKHCALRLPDDVEKWTRRSEELFKALTKDSNKVFEMNITILGIPDVVELFSDGTNIVDCLDILNTSYEEKIKSVGVHDISTTSTDVATDAEYSITGRKRQRTKVMLQTIVSQDEFYVVRLGVDLETLATIVDQLNGPNGGTKLPEYKGARSLCAAKYDVDGMYYRAMCVSLLSNPKKLVFFIDYGNTDMSSDVRCLPADLYHYKHLSKRCCLVKHSFNQLIYEHNFSELFVKALIPFWREPFEIEVHEKIGTTTVVDLFHRGRRFIDKITEDGSIPFNEPTPSNWDSFSERSASFINHNLSARLSEIMGDNSALGSPPRMPLTIGTSSPAKEVDVTIKDVNRNDLEMVIVTAIDDNNDCMFYARAPEFQRVYEDICAYITHFKSYNRIPLVKKMCGNEILYAIKCADSKYERCLVLRHISNNTYVVRLVDIGRTVAMNVDEVFKLSHEFATIPYQANKYKIAAGKLFNDSVASIVGVDKITKSDIGKTILISALDVDDDNVCHVDVYYSLTQNAAIEPNSDFNENDSFEMSPLKYVEDCNVTILEEAQSPIFWVSQSGEYDDRTGNFHRDAFHFEKMQSSTNDHNSEVTAGPSRSQWNEGIERSKKDKLSRKYNEK